MDKLTAIKIKYDDGTYSDEIPVSVLSKNVEWDNTHTLVDVLGSIDVDVTGTIQDQISQLFNEKVSATQLNNYIASQLSTDVTNWLNNNVDPVGSAVVVDSSLTIQGAAADAKMVGDLKSAFTQKRLNDFSEKTENVFDYSSATVLNLFWNTATNTLPKRDDCYSVLIPVDSSRGEQITITRPNNGRMYCVLLPFDDPTMVVRNLDVSSYTKKFSTNSNAMTFNLDSNTKSVFIWYYYSSQDSDNDPEYILSHLMAIYRSSGIPFEPYNAVDGFNRIQKSAMFGDPDFDSWDYMRNCIFFIFKNDGSLMHTPIGDNVNGSWVMRCEVFKDEPSLIHVLQTAYTFNYPGTKGTIDNVETYQRFRLYNRITGKWDTSSTAKWRKVKYSEDDTIISYITDDIIEAPYPWNEFVSPEASSGIWITDYEYPKGTVKTVKLNIGSEEDIDGFVIFINPYDGTIMEKIDFSGHGELTLDINEYFGNPFYLGIEAETSYYKHGTYNPDGRMKTRFIVASKKTTARGRIDLSRFNEVGTTTYCLAQIVTYASIKEEAYSKEYSKSHNSLYVIGDSITAGHNSYVIGNHWWEAIAREYGYEVKLGARTGAGMSYYNGTNAPKIVTQQDLLSYDVVLIAFGTNDYGNNQELGTIDDTYTYVLNSSQTFYAAAKYTVEKIKEKNPYATIIFSLPINRTSAFGGTAGSRDTKWAYGYQNSKGYTLNDYCEAIINVCNKYGLPYIDHRNGAYDVFSTPTYLYDGLHPSIDGYKVLGCEMIARFGAIIRPYPEYDGSGGPDVEHNQY